MHSNKQEFYTSTESQRQAAMAAFDNDGYYRVTVEKISEQEYRTGQQNKALHKGFSIAADRCRAAGITKADLYNKAAKHEEFNAPDGEDVKNVMREICRHLVGEPKTRKLPPDRVSEAWELLAMAFAQRLGIDIGPLPSLEQQRIQSIVDRNWVG